MKADLHLHTTASDGKLSPLELVQKAAELGRFLTGKSQVLHFILPCPVLQGSDDLHVRKRILSLTQEEVSRLGIPRGTLHYLRLRARNIQSFRIYPKVRQKLELSS